MTKDTSPLACFDADDIQYIFEGVLLVHHHSAVDQLELAGANLGYPVLLLIMSALDLVSSLCFDGSNAIEEYFRLFMSVSDPRYAFRFSTNLKKVKGNTEKRLVESDREYTNIGTVLREALRNRLVHSCGSVLEIDARKSLEHLHLIVRGAPNGPKGLFIHAYRLYWDYRQSLQHLYSKLKADGCLRATVTRNLGREWAHIMLTHDAVSELLMDQIGSHTIERIELPLKDESKILEHLRIIGQSYVVEESEK